MSCPAKYARAQRGHLASLVCWFVAVLIALAPALASAGKAPRARLRTLHTKKATKARTARNKRVKRTRPRAAQRGSKLSGKLRMRALGNKQKTKRVERKTVLGARLSARQKQKAQVDKRRLVSKTRGQKLRQRARTKARRAAKKRRVATRRPAQRKQHSQKTRLAAETLTNSGTLGLLASGAKHAHRAANLNRTLSSVLGIGAPLALAVGSTYAMSKATNHEQRFDASHGLLWAAQGGADFAGPAFAKLGVAAGLAGGGIQVGVGAYRIYTGIKTRNWPRVVTGILDTTAGSAWALSSISFALPTTMGIFIGATAVKMIYENRKAIAGGAKKLGNALTSWGKRLSNFGRPGKSKNRLGPPATASL